jgi:predicted phage tail protein
MLTAGVRLAGLAAGTYTASISIVSSTAGNSPHTVNVTLRVEPPALPGVPADLAATALDTGTIGLTWTASAGVVDGYGIERSTTPGSGFVAVDTVAAGVTAFQDTGLESGTTYYYRVRARNVSGFSNYSAVASATTLVAPPPVPGAPTDLTAMALDTATIGLTWTASAGVVLSYHIERSTTAGSGFAEVDTAAGSVTAFQDTGLEGGTTYHYRIRARNVSGFSDYSAEASATTPIPPPPAPGPPTNLSAAPLDTASMELTWTASAGVVDGYHVERSLTAGSGFTAVDTVAGGVTVFQDTGLENSTTYYYRVRARNISGFSNYSAEASATTPLPPPPVPGAPADLAATALDTATIGLSWTESAGMVDGYHIERSTTPGDGFVAVDTVAGGVTAFQNAGLESGTTYYYRVRARNVTGFSDYSAEASATTPLPPPAVPGPPINVSAVAADTTTIDLSWTAAGGVVDGYHIERSNTPGDGFVAVDTVAGGATVFQDIGLQSGTTYYYRVRARNVSGFSNYSAEASATTPLPPPPAPGPPTDVSASALDTATIELTWTASGGVVDGYHIERSLTPGSGFAAVDTVAGGVTTFQNSGLESGTTYYYRVRARNISGYSDYSAEASATTPEPPPPAPGPPTDLDAEAVNTSVVNLRWTASAGVVDGYHIERSLTPGDGFVEVDTVAGGVTAYQDAGLQSGTTYYYRVRARNVGGFSEYSAEASATTRGPPPPIPDAPSSLAAIGSGYRHHRAELDHVPRGGGRLSHRTQYHARWRVRCGRYRRRRHDGLPGHQPREQHHVLLPCPRPKRIRILQLLGGSFRHHANATAGRAGRPTDLTAVAIDTSTIDLAWTASAGVVDGYHIERSTTPGSGFSPVDTVAGGATVFQDTGLESGTTYYYRVRARNVSGFSSYSVEASATTPGVPPPVPGAPSDLSAVAVDTSTIDLNWTASAGVVDGYHIERSLTPGSGFAPVDTVAGGATAFQDTDLEGGTTYHYRVRARNESGFSNYSAEASATTPVPPPPVPGAPTDLSAAAVDTSTIDLSWTASAGVVDGYYIERSLAPGSGFAPVDTVAGGVTVFQDTDLESGTTYYYRVRGRNISGFSDYSAEASATTPVPPPPVPGAPTDLSAVATDTSTIDLSWTASGGVVDGYHIERSLTSGSGFVAVDTVAGGVTVFQDTSLESGTTYYYRVRGRNVSGFSSYSVEASATTPGVPPPVPGAPSDLSAVAVDTSTIDLNWTASAGVVDGYHVERSLTPGSGFVAVDTVAGGVTVFQDSGLQSGTTYYYRVRGRNVSGFSDYSAEASATTLTPPPPIPGAPTDFAAVAIDTSTIDLSWTASAGVVDGYHIERSLTPGSGFSPVDTVAGGATVFQDTGLESGTTYYYRVRGRNVSGFSDYSAEASATTPVPPPPVPGAPTDLAAVAIDTSTIDLSWTASAGVVDGYHIERSTTPGSGFAPVDTVAGGATVFQDTGIRERDDLLLSRTCSEYQRLFRLLG